MKLQVDLSTALRCKAAQLLRRAAQHVGQEREDMRSLATEYARSAHQTHSTEVRKVEELAETA